MAASRRRQFAHEAILKKLNHLPYELIRQYGVIKMKKSEKQIQNQIREVLSKYGKVFRINTDVFKTADGRSIRCGTKGMSDLLFVGIGRIAWLECKTNIGKISNEQQKFIEEMCLLGYSAGIVRSVEGAIKLINIK